jgi:hypothetical protein
MKLPIDQPRLLFISPKYQDFLCRWHGKTPLEKIHNLIKIENFNGHNSLVDINAVFSSAPSGCPYDRSGNVQSIFNYKNFRPWTPPTNKLSLDMALQLRVNELLSSGQKINLFWSGGIDSTAMLVAFLKHTSNLGQLRIIYSPFSTYEHPGYLDFLKKFNLELLDISGDTLYDTTIDGIMVTGDGGDEMHASLDQSFFELYHDRLHMPWQDLFYKKKPDDQFIEFCSSWFDKIGRDINTILEARWAFYAIAKNRCILSNKYRLYANQPNFSHENLLGFYDCQEFEEYIYHNIDHIINKDYASWKYKLKEYCNKFDHFDDWCRYKSKGEFSQLVWYMTKFEKLENKQIMMYLDNDSVISLSTLPFVCRHEFDTVYGQSLKHLFNDPN